MKIKIREKSYEEVMAIQNKKSFVPKKPWLVFRLLLRLVSMFDLFATKFEATYIGMERLGKKEPCLILMNHSSFIDLKIASTVLFPRPFNIVCTMDGFVGKNWLMRNLGCVPTKKFITDPRLVRNMIHCIKHLKSSVLMYPEAGYSLDSRATVIPNFLGKCLKMLEVPVVMIRTHGAFARDPLYNGLQKRKVKVTAEIEYLLSPDDIKNKSVDEINEILITQFSFDNFRWQQENNVCISEDFRADFLNRVLYKCSHCEKETMKGEGKNLTCLECGKTYELTEYGYLNALDSDTRFDHVPDWYDWERECVKREIEKNEYKIDVDVDIYMLVDTKCLYKVGEGRLVHDNNGFTLDGCDGKLHYEQAPTSTYSLNADYYWYEIGDVISIGNISILYYCFPKNCGDVVTKMRLATEELYKISSKKKVIE